LSATVLIGILPETPSEKTPTITPTNQANQVAIPDSYELPSFVKSEVGADYRRLGYLLESEKLKEADLETFYLLLWSVGLKERDARGYFIPNENDTINGNQWMIYPAHNS
jgi:hypothetical protein